MTSFFIPIMQRDAFASYLCGVSMAAGKRFKTSVPKIMDFPWKTCYNKIDCGIFVMRHMETYHGTSLKEWKCGFAKELDAKGEISDVQSCQINVLRHKYTSKILLCDVNQNRSAVEEGVDDYMKLSIDYRRKLHREGPAEIVKRLDGK